ncbi:acyl-CoA dehydrogenase family protein [candidate division KSB1 bacterium]|nr:acyl-CoA dehydrogenase family protein [candidate division KSB1 bacterium]
MPTAPTDKLTQPLSHLRAFLTTEVYPLEAVLLQQGFRALLPTLEQKRARVKQLGFWAPHLPKDLGGLGLTLPEFAQVSEVLGTSPLGHYLCNCQAPDIGNMELLLAHGNAEQQEKFLRPLAAGEIRSCFAMTEPEHAGSNPVWLSTAAVREGGAYVLNGHKWFASSAEGAAFAIVMAVTNPATQSLHRRASQIIVPIATPGFRLVRNISVMGEVGEDYFSHAEIAFENCRVPIANLIGQEGQGFALAQERLGPGRIHHCMRWIGICERAFDLMCQRAATRELAPGKLLASQEAIQHGIAECRVEINAARLLVMEAAHKLENEGNYAARVEISMIKFYVANVLQRVLDRAIQVHGALGVTDDTILSFWYRHERAARIYDGPDEVHKSFVAREVLKKYRVESL